MVDDVGANCSKPAVMFEKTGFPHLSVIGCKTARILWPVLDPIKRVTLCLILVASPCRS